MDLDRARQTWERELAVQRRWRLVQWGFATALTVGLGTFGLGVFLIVAGVERRSLSYVVLGCVLVIVTLLISTRGAFHISGGGVEIDRSGVVLPGVTGLRLPSRRRRSASRGPPGGADT